MKKSLRTFPRTHNLLRFLSVLVLVLLITNPVLACAGAKSGLILWAQAVLPALLPFMICSNVIVALDAIHILIFPFRPLLKTLLHLSDAGCYVFISGLLCGYPMGAKTCSEFLDERRISTNEGRYLLAICNHPSPMFLLGYAAAALPADVPVFQMLVAVYLPILPVALLAQQYYHMKNPSAHTSADIPVSLHAGFDDTLMSSCFTMVKIGGYIMLFSILAAYINQLPIPYPTLKAAMLGLTEITTGIQAIASAVPGRVGGMMICIACAFGGFSGIFQTKSVIKNAGLSIRHYITWKGLHSLLSCITFILLMYFQQA